MHLAISLLQQSYLINIHGSYKINIVFMLILFHQVLSCITSHCGHSVEDKTKIRQVKRKTILKLPHNFFTFPSSRYRRRQRLYVEMEQMASRPFGQVLVELERVPDTSSESSHHSRSEPTVRI